ncbi:MAG: acyl-CoA reductase [Vulcanimicrobiaceae bacterium]
MSAAPALPARRVLGALADAASRWREPDFPPRVRALRALEARTGYREATIELALDRLFDSLTAERLECAIAGELGALEALDCFVARAGRPPVRYVGLRRAVIVASETTPGVALVPLAFALCARVPTLVKEPRDGLVRTFLATLAEEEPALAALARAESWPSDDLLRSRASLAGAEVVIAFGKQDSLAAIRALLAGDARFFGYPPRTSAAYLAREALVDEPRVRALAAALALDALLYEGEGCLSLHALFVETGGTVAPERVAELLAEACEQVAIAYPPRAALDADSLAVHRSARFGAALGAARALAAERSGALILFEPPRDGPPPTTPPPLAARLVSVYAIFEPAEFGDFVAAHALPLAALATAPHPPPERILAAALASGISRIAPLGTLQDPPLAEHDGLPYILPFVRAVLGA